MIEDEAGEAYKLIGGRADAGIVILCDHASNAVPAPFGLLGLKASEFERHIAYDIGAAAIAERLAHQLGAPAIFTRVSRLLIDANRGADDPTLIMQLSDGAVVPGNRALTPEQREDRIARYYRPYHQAIDRVIARCMASGRPPFIFSVHSMTHAWKGVSRPWHVSILWQDDFGLAQPLLAGFRADSNLTVGDNVPYVGGLEGDTLYQHARPHRLPNAVIEYRQDLVADADGQARWADRTVAILRRILDAAQIQKPEALMSAPPKSAISQTELEAAAFRKLMAHLQKRTDVQNIDMMNLAGFCRNCLANWYQEAASANGLSVSKEAAREHIYGMPYKEWQAKHQTEATAEQKKAFEATSKHGH